MINAPSCSDGAGANCSDALLASGTDGCLQMRLLMISRCHHKKLNLAVNLTVRYSISADANLSADLFV